jgi:hypothetical protein
VGSQVGQAHKVLVPAGTQAGLVSEVEGMDGGAQRGDGGRRVEQLELCALEEGAQAGAGGEEVGVVAEDEFLERGRRQAVGGAAVGEALPADADGSIDADEEEEWTAQKSIDDGVVPDVGRDPALAPAQRDKVDEGVYAGEGVLGAGIVGIRIFGDGAGQVQACEAVLFNEKRGNRRLARADSWGASAAAGCACEGASCLRTVRRAC